MCKDAKMCKDVVDASHCNFVATNCKKDASRCNFFATNCKKDASRCNFLLRLIEKRCITLQLFIAPNCKKDASHCNFVATNCKKDASRCNFLLRLIAKRCITLQLGLRLIAKRGKSPPFLCKDVDASHCNFLCLIAKKMHHAAFFAPNCKKEGEKSPLPLQRCRRISQQLFCA